MPHLRIKVHPMERGRQKQLDNGNPVPQASRPHVSPPSMNSLRTTGAVPSWMEVRPLARSTELAHPLLVELTRRCAPSSAICVTSHGEGWYPGIPRSMTGVLVLINDTGQELEGEEGCQHTWGDEIVFISILHSE